MEALISIFKIPDLRRKVLITIALLALCRVGVYVTIPGVNVEALHRLYENIAQTPVGRVLGLMNLFAGGAFANCAVFGLGVMPYISASIIFQLLASVVPALEQLQKEGEAGRRKITQYTRYATVGLCFIQGFITIQGLRSGGGATSEIFPPGLGFLIMASILLTTGSMLLMWIGEQIDQYGIGNGISLIIMVGILDRLPVAIGQVATYFSFSLNPPEGEIGIIKVIVLILMFIGVVLGIIFITEGQRRIPFQQAKHVRGQRVYGGQRHYLPLRVNQASIFPIIFAQSLLMLPAMVTHGFLQQYQAGGWSRDSFGYKFWTMLNDNLQSGAFVYTVLYVALIFFFSFFWTAITFNPKDMANNMKDYGTFIPGIRPGARTAEYLEKIMTRITIPGAAFLSIIAILPDLIARDMGVTRWVSGFYGGTSILIVVGVALDLVRKIESHLLMRHYEGFMKARRK